MKNIAFALPLIFLASMPANSSEIIRNHLETDFCLAIEKHVSKLLWPIILEDGTIAQEPDKTVQKSVQPEFSDSTKWATIYLAFCKA
mgnify:CR=1 FL=1